MVLNCAMLLWRHHELPQASVLYAHLVRSLLQLGDMANQACQAVVRAGHDQ